MCSFRCPTADMLPLEVTVLAVGACYPEQMLRVTTREAAIASTSTVSGACCLRLQNIRHKRRRSGHFDIRRTAVVSVVPLRWQPTQGRRACVLYSSNCTHTTRMTHPRLAQGIPAANATRTIACMRAPQELKAQEAAERAAAKESGVHIEQLFDDPELQKLHEERLHKIAAEQEKRVRMSNAGHGAHSEITEGDFLEIVTKTPLVVCHFFHADFESCKIVDKHLAVLAKKYFDTRFIKLSAPVRGALCHLYCAPAAAFASGWRRGACTRMQNDFKTAKCCCFGMLVCWYASWRLSAAQRFDHR